MATRSYIFTETSDSNFLGSYCHWDGYPEGVGKTLTDNYYSPDTVRELCGIGGFSTLQETVEETAKSKYDGHDPMHVETPLGPSLGIPDLLGECAYDVDYVYLFTNNEWFVYETLYGEGSMEGWHVRTLLSLKSSK